MKRCHGKGYILKHEASNVRQQTSKKGINLSKILGLAIEKEMGLAVFIFSQKKKYEKIKTQINAQRHGFNGYSPFPTNQSKNEDNGIYFLLINIYILCSYVLFKNIYIIYIFFF